MTHSAENGLLIVYGASDDLIEVGGLLIDELNPPYGKPAVVAVLADDSAYTSLHVEYDPDGTGEWRIQPTSPGSLVTIVPARGEDEGADDDGCPGYSDKALVDMAGIEARRVNIRVLPPGDARCVRCGAETAYDAPAKRHVHKDPAISLTADHAASVVPPSEDERCP